MGMENEVWRDIEGFENKYQISNYGRVKSLSRIRKNKGNSVATIKERILKGKSDKDGYIEYALCIGSHKKMKFFRAHRLVAQAFIPNPNNYPIINHRDENPKNNFVWVNEDGTVNLEKSNLEWCDYKYNTNYSIHKVSKQIVYGGITYPSIRECSRRLGIDAHTIRWHLKHNTPYKNKLFHPATAIAA